MKQEQSRTLLLLCVVLLALFGIFFGVKKWNQNKSEKSHMDLAFQAEDISAISYQDAEGKKQSFQKENGKWVYVEDESIAMKQDTIEEMADSFANIPAVRTIEHPDERKDYGLDIPRYRIQLDTKSGIHHLLIGNKTGEELYFMEEGKDFVYTISNKIEEGMIWEIKTLAEQEEFPYIEPKSFERMEVVSPDGIQGEIKSDDTEAIVKDVTETLSNLYFMDCVDYHVTEETLSSYGLGEGERTTVSVEAKEQKTKFYIGKKEEKGEYYYVQLDGSQRVHRVSASEIEKMLAWN